MKALVLTLVLLAAAPTHAAFLLTPSTPPPAAPSPAPERVAIPPRPRPIGLPKAEGFGEAVPLHIAARQIVPEGTAIVFGDGVDREAPVDWKGGRAWNLVLADALKPLSLKVVRAAGQVTIIR